MYVYALLYVPGVCKWSVCCHRHTKRQKESSGLLFSKSSRSASQPQNQYTAAVQQQQYNGSRVRSIQQHQQRQYQVAYIVSITGPPVFPFWTINSGAPEISSRPHRDGGPCIPYSIERAMPLTPCQRRIFSADTVKWKRLLDSRNHVNLNVCSSVTYRGSLSLDVLD